jgi:hypothetical protein
LRSSPQRRSQEEKILHSTYRLVLTPFSLNDAFKMLTIGMFGLSGNAAADSAISGEIRASFEPCLSFLWRYDVSDPNTGLSSDATAGVLAALVWKATDKITFSLDYQRATSESKIQKVLFTTPNPADKMIDTDRKIFIHTIVNF